MRRKEGGVEIEHPADAFLTREGKMPRPRTSSEAPTWPGTDTCIHGLVQVQGRRTSSCKPPRRGNARWAVFQPPCEEYRFSTLQSTVARQESPRHASSPVRSFDILWRRRRRRRQQHRQPLPNRGPPVTFQKPGPRVSRGGVEGRPRGLEATPRGRPPSAYRLCRYRAGGLHGGCKYQLQPAF